MRPDAFFFLKKVGLLLTCLGLYACGVRREVEDIWEYIQDRPDSAITVLNALDTKYYHGRTLAEYRLLKAMALDKNFIDVRSDSLARPASEYFHNHGPLEKEMLSIYYLGMSHYYSNDLNLAAISLGRASEMAESCGDSHYEALSDINLSRIYYAVRNYEDAITMAKKSIQLFSFSPDSCYQTKWASVHLATCLITSNKYADASVLLEPLIYRYSSDTLFQQRALFPYAWSIYLNDKDKAKEAVSLFEKAIVDYHSSPNVYQYHHYGEMLLASGRVKDAAVVIETLKTVGAPQELGNDLQYKMLKFSQDYKGALKMYESLLALQNDVALQMMSQSLVRVQRDYQSYVRKGYENELRLEKNSKRMMIIIFSLSILIMILIVIITYIKNIEHQNRLAENIEEMRLVLDNTLESKAEIEVALETARNKYILAYKRQFQKISSLIENYYNTSGRKDGRDLVYKQVMELSLLVGKDRQSMKALERNVNVALDNAFTHYCSDFPGKTQEHYNLVCYFMVGFPASLIEMLTGISRNTIYSKKKRLLEQINKSDCSHRDLLLRSIR